MWWPQLSWDLTRLCAFSVGPMRPCTARTQTMPAWELRFTKGWFTRGGATSICPTPGCDFFASIRSLSPWRPSFLILRSKQCVEQPGLPCVNPPHHDFPEVQGVLPLASVLCCGAPSGHVHSWHLFLGLKCGILDSCRAVSAKQRYEHWPATLPMRSAQASRSWRLPKSPFGDRWRLCWTFPVGRASSTQHAWMSTWPWAEKDGLSEAALWSFDQLRIRFSTFAREMENTIVHIDTFGGEGTGRGHCFVGAGAIRPHQLVSIRSCRDMTYRWQVPGQTSFSTCSSLVGMPWHACQYAPCSSSGSCWKAKAPVWELRWHRLVSCLKSNALFWAGSPSSSCLGGTAFWKEVGARTSARPRSGEAKGRTLVLVLEIGPSSQHAIFCPARASRNGLRKAFHKQVQRMQAGCATEAHTIACEHLRACTSLTRASHAHVLGRCSE